MGKSRQIHQIYVSEDTEFVAPFYWVLVRRLNKGILLMSDMTYADISASRFVSIARPQEIGLPSLSFYFFLLMIIGTFTLSWPVKIKLTVINVKKLDIKKLVTLLVDSIHENPNFYSRASVTEIEQRLSRAKTFVQIRRAFE